MAKASDIGDRIRERRLARGYTQQQLSEAIGVTVESLSRAERGTILPTVRTMGRLAVALGTTIDALAGLPGPLAARDGAADDPPDLARLRHHAARLDKVTLRRLVALVERLPDADGAD